MKSGVGGGPLQLFLRGAPKQQQTVKTQHIYSKNMLNKNKKKTITNKKQNNIIIIKIKIRKNKKKLCSILVFVVVFEHVWMDYLL